MKTIVLDADVRYSGRVKVQVSDEMYDELAALYRAEDFDAFDFGLQDKVEEAAKSQLTAEVEIDNEEL